jgi:vacuolar-type H+-ATPase subunit E/Vma4
MALAELTSRLEREAESRIAAIRREADAQLQAIDAATAQAAAETTSHYLDDERARRHTAHAHALAAARRQARARALEATHAEIERILGRARALIEDVAASGDYLAALPAHADEALSFLEGLRPRVRCRAALAAVLRPAVERHAGATLVVDDAVGAGLIAEAGDGSVVVDNTLAARLARGERELASALARELNDGRR